MVKEEVLKIYCVCSIYLPLPSQSYSARAIFTLFAFFFSFMAEPSKFGAALNLGYFRFLSISHSGEALE